MSKHAYESGFGVDHAIKTAEQFTVSLKYGLFGRVVGPDFIGRHRLPDVRFSQELPGGTVYWSVNRKGFFRRDDSLPSGWVQRIYPRVATSFRTAE
ncbi:hypothetical protein PBI_RUFUS_43 [Mycobacterium phage Rufus]|uniref:hypothetical protein n=1 Tax=Mycobacterium phage Rufus TaxID=1698441 RepID=UPI0006BCA20B|nr:hypothetical protein AVV03_gp43 [Mycobacterium phage Rufus]AVJ49147.1 hypothetical protein SEA_BOB3_40 [Mycobacterium phage Bob3]AVJ50422.1 hypothetical protein SEA_MPLANT7149_41 [Mycobacterium phage MPlant7149]AVP42532.1 hypothetical protein SEA_LOPTON_43 [Mycobacterium phage Lopton]AXH43640.1 hypothetical protein SEA_BIGMAU_43 [Mycobacterium phage BigMau]AXH44990.1 hypothetical protein SEA_ROHR_43 [Mycobacterium phage Rohr]QDB74192.1 hypothetical protein SEA_HERMIONEGRANGE_42 [Mycobacter